MYRIHANIAPALHQISLYWGVFCQGVIQQLRKQNFDHLPAPRKQGLNCHPFWSKNNVFLKNIFAKSDNCAPKICIMRSNQGWHSICADMVGVP